MPTSSLKTSKSLVSDSVGGGESNQSSRSDYNRRRGAGGETVNSSYYDEVPTHETVHETLADLRHQIGNLSKARKDMREIIEKQEAQKEILGMPLLSPNYSQLGSVRDRSELGEAEN